MLWEFFSSAETDRKMAGAEYKENWNTPRQGGNDFRLRWKFIVTSMTENLQPDLVMV